LILKAKESVTTENYAGFLRRLLAFLVDIIVLYLIINTLSYIFFGFNPLRILSSMLSAESLEEMQNAQREISPTRQLSTTFINIYRPAIFLLPILYIALSWIYAQGATIGKKLMAIKIVKTDGAKLSWFTTIIRLIGYLLSFLFFGLGFLWIVWDKQKQGWHDKIAKTKVVKTDKKPKTFLALLLIIALIGFFIISIILMWHKGTQLLKKEMWFYESYQQAVEKMNPEAKKHWDQAQDLFAQMREKKNNKTTVIKLGNQAVVQLEKAAEIEPNNPRIWTELGKAYAWIGSNQKGLKAYQKAFELESKNVLYSNALADQFLRMKKYEAALNQFQKSLELYPHDGTAYFGLGLAYKGLKETDKAKENFQKALDIFEKTNTNHQFDQMIEKIKKAREELQ